MVGFTLKLTRSRIALSLLALITVILLLICAFDSAKVTLPEFSTAASTPAEREYFLSQFGWKCDISSETVKDSIIPQIFDEIYQPYNEIQQSQGFDLSAFAGQTVKLYSIRILNYPEYPDFVYASLLVSDGSIIGCDIHSTLQDGFMHGVNLTGTGMDIGQLITSATAPTSAANTQIKDG